MDTSDTSDTLDRTAVDLPIEPVVDAPLPLLAVWLWENRLGYSAFGAMLGQDGGDGVGREAVRKYCLPFSDPARMVPKLPTLRRIFEITGGVVTPAHFYPWDLFPRLVLHPGQRPGNDVVLAGARAS